jgi:hypothetical protein
VKFVPIATDSGWTVAGVSILIVVGSVLLELLLLRCWCDDSRANILLLSEASGAIRACEDTAVTIQRMMVVYSVRGKKAVDLVYVARLVFFIFARDSF